MSTNFTAAQVTRTVKEVTGVPARSFAHFARDYAAFFRGNFAGAG